MKILAVSVLALALGACGSSSDKKSESAVEIPTTPAGESNAIATETKATEGTPAATETTQTTETQAPATETPAGQTPAGEPAEEVPAPFPAPVLTAEVDATDKLNFAGLDLDGNKAIAPATLGQDLTWDLAFKRTVIKVQSPNTTVATIIGKTFEEVTAVPADAAFKSDAPVAGGKETDGLVFHADLAWYSYDMSVHVINTRGYVYLVKTEEGAIYKVAISDYYNIDRLPAFIQVKWQLLKAAPAKSAE